MLLKLLCDDQQPTKGKKKKQDEDIWLKRIYTDHLTGYLEHFVDFALVCNADYFSMFVKLLSDLQDGSN